MKHSLDRVLTTHAGSLPRSAKLLAKLAERQKGVPYDADDLQIAVREIVSRQVDLGIDIVTDGEMSKPNFLTYIDERLSGLEREKPSDAATAANPWTETKDAAGFPDYYSGGVGVPPLPLRMVCVAPLAYKGQKILQTDIANLKAAMKAAGVEEAFMPSISLSNVADFQINKYYRTEEEHLFALADAMREEYKAIIDSGLLLQVDDPNLVTHYMMGRDVTVAQTRKWAEVRVEALNHALKDLPEDRVRFHTCYSINIGPRVFDMELKDIIDIMLKVNAGAYSFEYGNPRHEHEWRIWKDAGVADNKILIPGVISNSTVVVEHPEVVAERLMRFASVVGRERIIAGADCGFATNAGSKEFAPSIVWAKLKSLAEGAQIASKQLWRN
jgi:5-methyltetrahydropteroyltriglutamate--homocysteine methyltransferase